MKSGDTKLFEHMVNKSISNRITLVDTIEEVLREAILSGVLKEGDELNQVKLASQFKVSRVPIREALLRLEAEGLIVSHPYKQAVVAALGPDVLIDIFDVRRLLELRGLELAIPHLTEEHFEELESYIQMMETTNDKEEWLNANREFHMTIYKASKREVLCAMIKQMIHRSVYFQQVNKNLHRNRQANSEHRLIIQALRNNDVEESKRLLAQHLDKTLADLVKEIKIHRGQLQDSE